MLLWVLIGIILLAVVVALVSSLGGKTAKNAETYVAPPTPEPAPSFDDFESPKASNWEEGAKSTVSKNFGKGGEPSGVSTDSGGIATSTGDDDLDWLKKAKPFEPRATNLNLDDSVEEELEPV